MTMDNISETLDNSEGKARRRTTEIERSTNTRNYFIGNQNSSISILNCDADNVVVAEKRGPLGIGCRIFE